MTEPRTAPPAQSLYLEDVVLGEEWRTGSHVVTPSDIAAFAGLTRDHHPLHTDAEYCRSRGFPAVIAHGLYGLALMEGLKTELRLYDSTSVASLGWDKVRFRAPVLAGDELHLRFRFLAKRASRNGGRGVVTEALELVNQRNEVVIDGEHTGLLLSRDAPG
jgi:acyl dehydratase